MYRLVWTTSFTRTTKKFLRQHPDLRPTVAALLRDLEQDPFQPHLRFHHLGGNLKGVQAVSLTRSYRITLSLIVSEKEIILLDIGSHDDVYR